MFIVKTERDLEKAMDPGGVDFPKLHQVFSFTTFWRCDMVVTPILLPFILVFFASAYLVYCHQVINVYNKKYESAAAFWPHVNSRIIASLIISQLLVMGLMSTKKAANSTPWLVVLPILNLAFHKYCKNRFELAFRKYPLEEAMTKDMQDPAAELDSSLKSYLSDAYLHPIFHSFEEVELVGVRTDKNESHVVNASQNDISFLCPHRAYHRENETTHSVQHHEVESEDSVHRYDIESHHDGHRY